MVETGFTFSVWHVAAVAELAVVVELALVVVVLVVVAAAAAPVPIAIFASAFAETDFAQRKTDLLGNWDFETLHWALFVGEAVVAVAAGAPVVNDMHAVGLKYMVEHLGDQACC